jgi:CheY-like chemotaxis protein
MKHKVLWIEDGAFAEMQKMSAPIYVSGKYDLVIAIDATEGLQQLKQKAKQFETIIVDIRLPPGTDAEFQKIYKDRNESRTASKLGLTLLRRVLKEGAKNDIPKYHREPQKFGIFTVEGYTELQPELDHLGVSVYHQKTELYERSKLRDIIEEIRIQNLTSKG